MKSLEKTTEPSKGSPRFSLRAMHLAVAGIAVLCALVFVLIPDLWLLVTEMPWLRKAFAAILAMTGVFILIITVSVIFRLATLAMGGTLENSSVDSKRL